MIHLNQVLCPVVLSNAPDAGLHCAVALAQAHDAKLLVLHCVTDDGPSSSPSQSDLREALKQSLTNAVALQDRTNGRALDWEPVIVQSSRPSEAITAEAGQREVDLIVMSSRHRPFAAPLLGSTSEGVIRKAPCPLLLTRFPERWTKGITFKRLLIAYDFSADSEMTLSYGLALAQEYQAQVHLLHVLADSPTAGAEITWNSPDAEGPYHEAARRLQQSIPAEVHLWCDVTHAVREGKPHREILSYALEHDIDLICIGAQGKGFQYGGLFGSNADRVLRESPCPVLVVRPPKSQKKEIVETNQRAAA